MSTAAVSSTSVSPQLQQYFQVRESNLKQLGQALRNGDLAGAQAAYSKVISLGYASSLASNKPFAKASLQQDFTNIGKALQSGDLAGAQNQFAALRASLQRGSQPPDAVPTGSAPAPAPASGPEIILNLSPINTGGSASPEQITINISNPARGGEQVSIGIGTQGSSPAEQVTLNFAPNSNEQIVLNLLGASSASSGSSTSSTATASGTAAAGGLNVSA